MPCSCNPLPDLTCLAAPGGRSRVNPNLKYFSVWEADAGSDAGGAAADIAAQKGWLNFLFTTDNATTIRAYHSAGLGPSLFAVRSTFFCGSQLCADYETRWAALLNSTIRPMLEEGSLFGVFFGVRHPNHHHFPCVCNPPNPTPSAMTPRCGAQDEICWSCTPWSNVSAAVDTVRRDLERGEAILYYNEAFPVIAGNGQFPHICDRGGDFDDHRNNFSYPRVPTGLDWISVDYCEWPCLFFARRLRA